MTQLPPPRDLPSLRHARMRAEVLRAVEGPAPRRRAVVPLAAAASVTALVAVGAWALNPADVPAPAAPPAAAPTTTTAQASPFPGFTQAEIDKIERECVSRANAAETLELRNVIRDELGTLAILGGKSVLMTCQYDGQRVDYDGRLVGYADDPEVGVFTLDTLAGSSGKPGRPGSRVVGGRVLDERVVRVSVYVDGRSADVAVVGGTYLTRIVFPTDWEAPVGADAEVTAHDSEGRPLGSIIT